MKRIRKFFIEVKETIQLIVDLLRADKIVEDLIEF